MIDLLINEINKDKNKIINFLQDNYFLKEGIYLKIDIDKPFKGSNFKDYIIVNAKEKDTSKYICNLNIKDRHNLIEYILKRDKLSGMLNDDANKAIPNCGKKIFSTTYQAICFSNKAVDFKDKDKDKAIKDFYDLACANSFFFYKCLYDRIMDSLNLKPSIIKNSKISEELETIKSENRLAQIKLNEKYLKDNFSKIIDFIGSKKISKTSKVKIFFYSSTNRVEDDLNSYNREYSYYLYNCLLNKKTAKVVNGEIKGAISYGFNNNENKPLLRPRRMNIPFVKMHSIEEALDTKLTYDLLKLINDNNSSKPFGFDRISFDKQFHCDFNELSKACGQNKPLNIKLNYIDKYIEEYDLVAERSYKNAIASRRINCKNYLFSDKEFKKTSFYTNVPKSEFSTKELLAFLINSSMDSFNKYSDYKMVKPMDINGAIMLESKNGILFSKYKFLIDDFLKASNPSEDITLKVVESYTKEVIEVYLNTMFVNKSFIYGVRDFLNIKLNLLNEYRGEHILLKSLESMKIKLNSLKNNKNYSLEIENDYEYYFLLGQLSYYIESKFRKDTDFGIFRFYLDKKVPKNLVKYFIQRFELVGYDISLGDNLFKNMLSTFLAYTPNKNITEFTEVFYMGICSENIFYKSKES